MKKEDTPQLADDLETLADWKEDLVRRTRAADLCAMSRAGLADETLNKLLHEGKAWLRACYGSKGFAGGAIGLK